VFSTDPSLSCNYKKEIKKIIKSINFRRNPKKDKKTEKTKSRFKSITLTLFRKIKQKN
jgi:hypothetical protein